METQTQAENDLFTFKLGNYLRGGYGGHFSSVDEAWQHLGSAFLLENPCKKWVTREGNIVDQELNPEGCRHVNMYIYEINKYGLEQPILCRLGDFKMSECIPVTSDQYEYLPPGAFM